MTEKIFIQFEQLIISTHVAEGDATPKNHLSGRAIFHIKHGDWVSPKMQVTVAHPYGTSLDEPFEVGSIDRSIYKGPFDFLLFTECVDDYCRLQIGPNGQLRFGPNTNVKITNSVLMSQYYYEIDVEIS